jgi:hypothetical protein
VGRVGQQLCIPVGAGGCSVWLIGVAARVSLSCKQPKQLMAPQHASLILSGMLLCPQVSGARKVSVSSEAEALALFFEVGPGPSPLEHAACKVSSLAPAVLLLNCSAGSIDTKRACRMGPSATATAGSVLVLHVQKCAALVVAACGLPSAVDVVE